MCAADEKRSSRISHDEILKVTIHGIVQPNYITNIEMMATSPPPHRTDSAVGTGHWHDWSQKNGIRNMKRKSLFRCNVAIEAWLLTKEPGLDI